MHATIQKPLEEILDSLEEGEKLFVVGCGNCAAKAKSGGEPETEAMAERLSREGVDVVGWAVPPDGGSLCKLSATEELLNEAHGEETENADSFLVLACGQGIHTVIDATEGNMVHAGCNTIFGGETTSESFITEYCSLCGECLVEATGGLCPLTLCSKSLLNGPCGGATDGKCEISPDRDCGWHLIFERLKELDRTDLMMKYQPPKNWLRSSGPRSLSMSGRRADFTYAGHTVSAWSGTEEPPEDIAKGGEE
ncbi:MAG: methylenetetrahydrofolate reductase C-terminal domain-containing protein [Planctomycetes bacterium]|nr:methylenetetrahydrofolate reductase C-terminal domain-containing protein [Planctomycetota bacterium]